jgi:hypothetical protein
MGSKGSKGSTEAKVSQRGLQRSPQDISAVPAGAQWVRHMRVVWACARCGWCWALLASAVRMGRHAPI